MEFAQISASGVLARSQFSSQVTKEFLEEAKPLPKLLLTILIRS